MAPIYTWSFPQFDVAPLADGLTDVVKTIHWRVDGVDGEYSAGAYGSVALEPPNPSAFTPFTSISEQWAIDNVVQSVPLADIQNGIEAAIEAKRNPPVVGKAAPF